MLDGSYNAQFFHGDMSMNLISIIVPLSWRLGTLYALEKLHILFSTYYTIFIQPTTSQGP